MDPLSAVLAAITFATAVKDMAELVDKLRSSFEKVSSNLRNAQNLASEIGATIHGLRDLCAQHDTILGADLELKRVLENLIAKLEHFNAQIVSFIPSPHPKFRDHFKFNKNARIEAKIEELKEDLKRCHDSFMMMNFVQILVKQKEMNQSISAGFQAITQRLTNNPTTSVALPLLLSHQRPPENLNRQIFDFAQSSTATSAPLLKTPSVFKNQMIGDVYLKEQIHSIAKALSDLSTLKITYSMELLEAYTGPFAPMVITSLQPEYCDPISLHRDVVTQAHHILETIENQPANTSVKEGAWSLVDLSIGLHYLGMPEEAVSMGKWAVDLFRALAAMDKLTYSPFLAHGLKHLAHFYTELGNMDAAKAAIEDAVHISQSLQNVNTPLNLRIQYSAVLTTFAKHVSLKDHGRGVELATQSLQHMEQIINVKALPVPYSKELDGVVQVNDNFLVELYRHAPSDHAVVEYARAMRELSDCLVRNDQLREALDFKLFALAIFNDLPGRISNSMNEELGSILFDVINQPTKSLLSPEKLLLYVEDYIEIIRKKAKVNASLRGRTLCNALWEKASLLNQLRRHDDAVAIWKEIAGLGRCLIQDQSYYANALSQVSWSLRSLQRYDEAVEFRKQSLGIDGVSSVVSSWNAFSYYDLCIELQLAERHSEAVQVARNALDQSRELAMVEPDLHVWVVQIGRAHTALANSLLHVGDHPSAMDQGLEALKVFERLVSNDPTCVSYYLYALRINLDVAMTANDTSASVTRFQVVIQQLRQLSTSFPEDVELVLLEAEVDYGHNLDRLNQLTEAKRHLGELLAQWHSRDYSSHCQVQITTLRVNAYILYATILDNQGYSELALEQIIQAYEIGKPFCSTHPAIAEQNIGAMYRHAQLLVELGHYRLGVDMAEEALKFSRSIQTNDLSNVVGAMHVVAIAAEHVRDFNRLTEISMEAVSLCQSADMVEYCQSDPEASILLPRLLQLLSSGKANQGLVEGLVHALDAVEEAEKLKSSKLIPPGDAEKSYMAARGHLGIVLFAHGNFGKAREIFEEQRLYLQDRVKVRYGEYKDLVAVLYRLGIMHCHDGHHTEGALVRELTGILSHLEIVHPGLYKLVRIDMRHELSMPMLQDLQAFRQHLNCSHHYISFD